MITISKTLSDQSKCALPELKELQGNLKQLKDKQLFQMIASFVKYGFSFPFFVWIDKDGTKWVFDGHQRLNTLNYLSQNALYAIRDKGQVAISDTQKEGYLRIELPEKFPYVSIEAKNKKEAKEKLLLANSQYGEVTKEGFDEFTAELDFDFVKDFTTGFEGFFDRIDTIDELEMDSPENDSSEKAFTLQVECINEKELKALKKRLENDGYKVVLK